MALAQPKTDGSLPPGQRRGDPLAGREDAYFRAANDPNYAIPGVPKAAANDPYYNSAAQPSTIDSDFRKKNQTGGVTPATKPLSPQNPQVVPASAPRRVYRPPNPTLLKKQQVIKEANGLTDLTDRARATVVIMPIILAQIPFMLIQLKFGVIGALFFGAVGALDAAASTEGKGLLGSIVAWSVDTFLSLGRIVGIDFAAIALAGYFICFMIIISITFYSVLTATISMMLARLNPLSGTHATTKLCTLLAVFIGYSLPIVNMFPWILAYLLVVWLYPK